MKDSKDKNNLIKIQQELKEKYCRNTKKQEMTKEQEESAKEFYKQFGIEW